MDNKYYMSLVDENRALMELFHLCDNEFVNYTVGEVEGEMMDVVECALSGFVFVKNGNPVKIPEVIWKNACGLFETNKSFNQTFHKSFGKVARSDIETLVIEQLVHYFSTYGMEVMGVSAHPWIPTEELHIPVDMPAKLIVINIADSDEITRVATEFFTKVKQPNSRIKVGFELLFDKYFYVGQIEYMKSFELQIIAYRKTNTIPKNPISVLRYMQYSLTGQTLLVNSPREANMIKTFAHYAGKDCWNYSFYAERANEAKAILLKADIEKMSTIFFKYKNLFLAYKKFGADCAHYVNRMRRMAEHTHKPLNDVCLQNFTKLIAEGRYNDAMSIIDALDVYDTIKLINIIRFRLWIEEPSDAVFSIRNGRTYVKENAIQPIVSSEEGRVYFDALARLASHLQNLVDLKGKSFVIPSYMTYTVPTSQKQMISNIPWGTTINYNADKAITMGIAWNNVGHQRVDLDLHMHGKDKHYGWNGSYRNGEEVFFTGDMTDAMNGAAEAFYFKPLDDEIYCLDVALYCGAKKVPFKFCITEQKPRSFDRNYTFDGSELVVPAINLELTDEERVANLGFVKDGIFTFYGGSLSNNIGAASQWYGKYLENITNKVAAMLDLSNFIILCGGAIFHEDADDIPEDAISLLPEDLTADTFVNIMTGAI